ncbi:MAG: glycoside hydrolase family 38 C-terminal domain-containing protein, partial [Planctomycetota bacterium]
MAYGDGSDARNLDVEGFDPAPSPDGQFFAYTTFGPVTTVVLADVDLDLQRTQCLVKLVFPTGYAGREARYGGPFGSVRRPQWPGPLANDAMFENPASRWLCVADDDEQDGLMVITESKYGAGVTEGRLHVSLARSAKVTPTNAHGNTTELESGEKDGDYADLGRQTIRLAVGHFSAQAPRAEQPAALADLLFTPPIRYTGRPIDAGFAGLDGPASLVPAWAVPDADGGWTLRAHETLGGRGRVAVRLADEGSAKPVDLRGETVERDAASIGPYELLSWRMAPSADPTP